jgi:ABC-2 type transport system permease protein
VSADEIALPLPRPAPSGRLRIVRTIAAKEWLDLRRDTRFRLLAALMLLLLAGAVLFGATQVARMELEHEAASAADRSLWTAQGAKDPHSAAHFGQYAFKPASALALADPGIDAYVGSAVWLEAHKQNEVQFRPASDGSLVGRLGKLSLAFVLQTVMPLLVILLGFSAFTGERENGTLRQLLSLGVRPLDLLAGKALAIGAALLLLLIPVFAGVFLGCLLLDESYAAYGAHGTTDVAAQASLFSRLAWLGFSYALYLAGFVALSLAVSAWLRSSRAALVVLLAFWLVNCFLMPRLMTDWVREALPLPTALSFRQAIVDDKKKLFGHDERHPAFVAFKARVLAQYKVQRIEDLPVNFRGLALREDDEAGYRIFDRHFGALQARFERQDAWRAASGFLVPALAMQPFSMALAGTDSRHHHHFASEAEAHRRLIQAAVSDDLIRNGRYGDSSYTAPPELWARIPSFAYRAPDSGWALASQTGNLVALLFWAAATSLAAAFVTRRLRPV